MSTTPHRLPPEPGDPAPPLELALLDGGRCSLVDLRGRAALIIFLRHAG